MTCSYIAKFYKNYYQNTFDGDEPGKELVDFVESNDKWLRRNVEESASVDPYWRHVGSILSQFDGMSMPFDFNKCFANDRYTVCPMAANQVASNVLNDA